MYYAKYHQLKFHFHFEYWIDQKVIYDDSLLKEFDIIQRYLYKKKSDHDHEVKKMIKRIKIQRKSLTHGTKMT